MRTGKKNYVRSLVNQVCDIILLVLETILSKLTSTTMYIYCLRDPRDGKIRYVGRTRHLQRRYGQHVGDGRKFLSQFGGKLPTGRKQTKVTWIAELLHANLTPIIETLEIFDVRYQNPDDVERKWIKYHQKKSQLFNILMKERKPHGTEFSRN